MSFSKTVKIEAMVRSQRKCCVCHRYNGVGIEIHHIRQKAVGGNDSLANAIALCFDCHCAAGHYNNKHPRGNKFSPNELLRHRDEWWERVKLSGTSYPSEDILPDYYVRHLISFDDDAAREIFAHNKKDLPFDFTFMINNQVSIFMQEVLADDLPFTWATSKSEEGLYWKESCSFETKEDFFKANPEFKGKDHRPLVPEDFKAGGVNSKLLRSCFQEGMPIEKIGSAIVEMDMCGGPTVFSYYSVRRPIFVFALIENKSDQPIIINKLLSRRRDTDSTEPKPFKETKIPLKEIETAPIRLERDQSVLVPEMVLLSSPHEDDSSYIKIEYRNITRERGQELGFGSNKSLKKCDYWLVGPCDEINGFGADISNQSLLFPFHRFNPQSSYSIARYWCCGSCPHVFFQKSEGHWEYSQEILTKGFRQKDDVVIKVPPGVIKLMIFEVEFEISTLTSLTVNGRDYLENPRNLSRGESLEIKVKSGDIVIIEGHYTSSIQNPQAPVHLRQKATLLKAAQIALNS